MNKNIMSERGQITTIVEQPVSAGTYQDLNVIIRESDEDIVYLAIMMSLCDFWEKSVDAFANIFKISSFMKERINRNYRFDSLKKAIKNKVNLATPLNKIYEKKGSICELFEIYSVNTNKIGVGEFRFADTVDDYINVRNKLGVDDIHFDKKIDELNECFLKEVSLLGGLLLVDMIPSCEEYKKVSFENDAEKLAMQSSDDILPLLNRIPLGIMTDLDVEGLITYNPVTKKSVMSKCSESCLAVSKMNKLSPRSCKIWHKQLGRVPAGLIQCTDEIKHPFHYASKRLHFLDGVVSVAALSQCHGITPWSLIYDQRGLGLISSASCGLPALKATSGKVLLGDRYDECLEIFSAGFSANCVKDIMRLYGIVTNTVPSDYIIELRKQLLSVDEFSISSAEKKLQSSDNTKVKVLVLDGWISSAEESVKFLCNKAVDYLRGESLIDIMTLSDIFTDNHTVNESLNDFSSQYSAYNVLFDRYKQAYDLLYDKDKDNMGLPCNSSLQPSKVISKYVSNVISNNREINYLTDKYIRHIKNIIINIFSSVDVIVCPLLAATSIDYPKEYWGSLEDCSVGERIARYMIFPALTGIPVMTVPIGLSDGMPVGIQIMGAEGSDYLIGIIAEVFEKKFERIPIPRETPMRSSVTEIH